MFQPTVLNPTPDPWIVRELKRIDPDLRISWGYNRYLQNSWVIERRMPPERYFTAYANILSGSGPRFIEQPVFDTDQSVLDPVTGEHVSYKQIGTRQFDLAPEYEWVAFVEHADSRLITEIRRIYAEERNRSVDSLRIEQEQELQKREEEERVKRFAAMDEGFDEVFLDTRKKVQFGYGESRNEQ